jgi:hypothetical protein
MHVMVMTVMAARDATARAGNTEIGISFPAQPDRGRPHILVTFSTK